jgi:hypothetical protein
MLGAACGLGLFACASKTAERYVPNSSAHDEDAGPKLSIKGGNPPGGRSFDLTDAAIGFVGGEGGVAVGSGGADAGVVADAGGVSPFEPDSSLVETCPVPLPTGFCFASQAGDYIGAGATIFESPADGTLEVTLADDTLSVSFNGDTYWHVDVDGPDGEPLALGAHEDATRFPFNEPTTNGLSVGGDGRGCNMLFGRFDVLELETDADDGSLVRAAIDLEQHCEAESAPALFAKIRFESTLE